MNKHFLLGLCISLALAFGLGSTAAQAGYRPPRTARLPQGPAIPGGRRGGCAMPADVGLTALSPQGHVGRTQSLQPTLAWFVPSEVPYEMTLQLYKYADTKNAQAWTLIEQRSLGQSQYGYMHHALSPNSELTVGNLYRWNIILTCDPSRPSASRVASAQFEIVPPQVEVDISTTSGLQLANRYLEAGLWYDAIAVISSSSPTPESTTYLSQLLLNVATLDETSLPLPSDSMPSPLRRIARLITEETSETSLDRSAREVPGTSSRKKQASRR